MEVLKPCPFCGSEDIYVYGRFFVGCDGCESDTAIFETSEEAIKAWNRRVKE